MIGLLVTALILKYVSVNTDTAEHRLIPDTSIGLILMTGMITTAAKTNINIQQI